jgi:hypothetical protein
MDSAYARVAIWEIKAQSDTSLESPSELQSWLEERQFNIEWDRLAGQPVFERIVDPLVKTIREQIHMPPNPVMDAPSDNVDEWIEQTGEVIRDTIESLKSPKDVIEHVGKMMVGSFVDIFTSGASKDVARERQPLHDAISEGIASGLDSSYTPRFTAQNDQEQHYFSSAKTAVENLTSEEKYQLAVFLVEAYRNDLSEVGRPTSDYIQLRLEGSIFSLGAERIFSRSKYRYR